MHIETVATDVPNQDMRSAAQPITPPDLAHKAAQGR